MEEAQALADSGLIVAVELVKEELEQQYSREVQETRFLGPYILYLELKFVAVSSEVLVHTVASC